ncbi:MAG: hypothetical protein JSW13_00435 [Candidatus Aerophobus sp.]|nr:MAG: hypothetical protein JSW13_00435 [Candidatus Aerophobus sp.]
MHEYNHQHDTQGHPEGHGGEKPVKIEFSDFKMERAFAFDPDKGEKGIITYTIPEPARISIKVIKARTRELYLATILNWEYRDAGTHTEKWDGRDYEGNIIDMSEAIIVMEGEPMSTFAPGEYSLDGLSDEEIVHGHPSGHAHNVYDQSANIVPELKITSVRDGDILSGLVTIESHLEGEKGYGDEAGYGVRYYLDHTLLEEEFYEESCNGRFSYTLDTTAFLDGEYTLYVGMCDHHQHATSRGHKIKIKNSLSSKDGKDGI